MAITGKTGADAVAEAARKSVRTLERYAAKFDAVITAAYAAGALTSDEAILIRAFVAAQASAYSGLIKLAAYSGIN